MGIVRKSLFVGTGGLVAPNSKKQRNQRQILAALQGKSAAEVRRAGGRYEHVTPGWQAIGAAATAATRPRPQRMPRSAPLTAEAAGQPVPSPVLPVPETVRGAAEIRARYPLWLPVATWRSAGASKSEARNLASLATTDGMRQTWLRTHPEAAARLGYWEQAQGRQAHEEPARRECVTVRTRRTDGTWTEPLPVQVQGATGRVAAGLDAMQAGSSSVVPAMDWKPYEVGGVWAGFTLSDGTWRTYWVREVPQDKASATSPSHDLPPLPSAIVARIRNLPPELGQMVEDGWLIQNEYERASLPNGFMAAFRLASSCVEKGTTAEQAEVIMAGAGEAEGAVRDLVNRAHEFAALPLARSELQGLLVRRARTEGLGAGTSYWPLRLALSLRDRDAI
jgi:hypothetical protein